MALTPELIKRRFPELSLVTDERVEVAILESTIIMGDDVNRWLGQEIYYMANSYLVAHLITVMEAQFMGDDSSLAPVKKTSVDHVEIEYAVSATPNFNDSELASTSYGKRFLFYRNMCFTGGIVV